MTGERLKKGLELEMRSEWICWPLCGELLQLVSDSFGGHRESCSLCDDQRSFKLMQNGGQVHVRHSVFAFPTTDEMKKKHSWEKTNVKLLP